VSVENGKKKVQAVQSLREMKKKSKKVGPKKKKKKEKKNTPKERIKMRGVGKEGGPN